MFWEQKPGVARGPRSSREAQVASLSMAVKQLMASLLCLPAMSPCAWLEVCGCWELLAASVRKVNGCVSAPVLPGRTAPHRGPSTRPHPPGLARPGTPHYTTLPLCLHHIAPLITPH